MPVLLLFAIPAVLGFTVLYRVTGTADDRLTLRYAALTVTWAAAILLIISWS
jgi:hypothetical protein